MAARIRLVRTVAFRAYHRLVAPGVSEEDNRRRFGWTAEPHGHHYRCTVTVSAPLGDTDAMVIELPVLDRLLAEEVIGRFEGRQLHRDIPELAVIPTTCEAIARLVFRRLSGRLPAPAILMAVRIAEDDSLAAEVVESDR